MKKLIYLLLIFTLLASQSFAHPPTYGADPLNPPAGDIDLTGTSTNQVLLPCGTAAAPGLVIEDSSGNLDNGLYCAGTDTLGITIGGAARWEVTGTYLQSASTSGGSIQRDTGATDPAHTFNGDDDTGLGRAAANIPVIIGGGVPLQVWGTIITLSAANINALAGSPITLVATQGANKLIEFVGATFVYDNGGTGFTVQADENIAIRYNDGSGTIVSTTVETVGFIDQTDDEVRIVHPLDTLQDTDVTGNINQPLVIDNVGSGEFDNGNGVLRVHVTYRVHSMGL